MDIGASANLEVVDNFCYLGDMLSADAAVEARIQIGWNKFRQLLRLLTNRDISLIMVALCNRVDHCIFILFLSSSSSSSFFFFLFFSSPNLSGRRLDVYHTLAHGVALVRI